MPSNNTFNNVLFDDLANKVAKERNVDLVFCIDATGSMSPCIKTIKDNARRFYQDVASALTANGDTITRLRVKIIAFRDYKYDGDASMVQSEFYELPNDADDFNRYLDNLQANGGGDPHENGLEALYYAMMTPDWTQGNNDRQIIVLFTDTDALALGERNGCPNYPADMVDLDGLKGIWSGAKQIGHIVQHAKRLVMFAPAGTIYDTLQGELDHSVCQTTEMLGLEDLSFDTIVQYVVTSIQSD